MKTVTVTLFILIILFLSEQIDLSIKIHNGVVIKISFILFTVILIPRKKEDDGTDPKGFISPAIKSVKHLCKGSKVSITVLKGPAFLFNTRLHLSLIPVRSILIPLLCSNCSDLSYRECVNFDEEGSSIEINFHSSVIFFLSAITIFIRYLLLDIIERKRKDAG